jgi:hypothetical protein
MKNLHKPIQFHRKDMGTKIFPYVTNKPLLRGQVDDGMFFFFFEK